MIDSLLGKSLVLLSLKFLKFLFFLLPNESMLRHGVLLLSRKESIEFLGRILSGSDNRFLHIRRLLFGYSSCSWAGFGNWASTIGGVGLFDTRLAC